MTPSQRLNLLTTPTIGHIDGGACEERIITHEVKELGEHSLVCSANYTVQTSGEELYLRKFFKFNVRFILVSVFQVMYCVCPYEAVSWLYI